METVTLYTSTGGVVTTVDIPVFNPPAEVIIWGQRFFVRRDEGEYTSGHYYEGMAWVVLPTPTKNS